MNGFIDYLEKEQNIRNCDEITYRSFMENMPLYMFSIQGRRFTYANPATLATLGYTITELRSMNWWDVVHPEYQNMMIERNRLRIQKEAVPDRYEIIVIDKGGRQHWIEILNTNIEAGGVCSTISAALDIGERKRIEEELHQSQREMEDRVMLRTAQLNQINQEISITNNILRNIIINMSDGILIVDVNGNVEDMNPMAREILKESLEFLHFCANNKDKSVLWRMLNLGQPFRDEEYMITTKKGNVHFLASGSPIHNEQGEIQRGVIIVRPIKEVHRLINRFTGAAAKFHFEDIAYQSSVMARVIELAQMAASKDSNVLLEGESGTGKELFAQAIHNKSRVARGPFVALNCGAIPRELIASELFGYAEGAFTGAKKGGNPGKFELAAGGTIFLDEIGDMPLEEQSALLRVIQEKSITRVGGNRLIPVDVRIICASNKNLYEEVKKGNFRQDLYYRLHVLAIQIPPLRERPQDIPVLFRHFLKSTFGFDQESIGQIDPRIYLVFEKYLWPGNVRELQNVTERMVHMADGRNLQYHHLPAEFAQHDAEPVYVEISNQEDNYNKNNTRTRDLLAQVERREIIRLLDKHKGNISQVARDMGFNRRTIHRKIKTYGIKS
ncbi:MAG: sigma 54-interacting transcriptional regulator [Syntrophomonadaceae bacterium]